jgi:hypothetical protein
MRSIHPVRNKGHRDRRFYSLRLDTQSLSVAATSFDKSE